MSGPESQRETPAAPDVGDTALDARTGRVGRVMGHVGPYVQLRPLNGGCEWDARPEDLSSAHQSDALSPDVAAVNARSRR
ncbi:hypothetical protein [Streptomyces sp. JJ38]|uniref:hypothetical protein n=1 Tax=Streptomyces sp. JJ38 TaxID=2738128 RepID=UPI0035AD7752